MPQTAARALDRWGCGEKGQLCREVVWERDTKKAALLPARPVTLRLPGADSLGGAGRKRRALNDNFINYVRSTLKGEPGADMTAACERYLEHR